MNTKTEAANNLLSDHDAAKYLDLANGTLAVWRCNGRYNIPFIKIGAKVRYRRSDLDAWLESRTQKATA
jgi:excisionase family DNA binding protein